MHNAVEALRERVLVLRDMERNHAPDGLLYIDRPDLLPDGDQAGVTDENGQKVADVLLQGGVAKTKDKDGTFQPTVMPPWKDVSINWVPIRFQPSAAAGPAYSDPPVIKMEGKKEFWRVSNAAADTYFRLQVIYDNEPQTLHVVAMDGIPLGTSGGLPFADKDQAGKVEHTNDGRPLHKTVGVKEILLPPAGRAEFILQSPAEGVKAEFLTLFYDTNADYDPRRTLARIEASGSVAHKTITAHKAKDPHVRKRFRDSPSTVRHSNIDHTLVFHQDTDPSGNDRFYIEEPRRDGTFANQVFEMTEKPRITVPHGAVQVWKIVNQRRKLTRFTFIKSISGYWTGFRTAEVPRTKSLTSFRYAIRSIFQHGTRVKTRIILLQ